MTTEHCIEQLAYPEVWKGFKMGNIKTMNSCRKARSRTMKAQIAIEFTKEAKPKTATCTFLCTAPSRFRQVNHARPYCGIHFGALWHFKLEFLHRWLHIQG